MMTEQDISKVMEAYVVNQEISGGALIVRKNDQIVYKNKWGYQDLGNRAEVEYNTIYRMMSMTKCITAVAVMKLMEEGKLELDDKVSKYIPEFAKLQVVSDPRYVYKEGKLKHMFWKLLTFHMDKVKTVPANREITIRDLLSHASGLEQGLAGFLALLKMKNGDKTLEERVKRFSTYALDFQPGTMASYSPTASFDILGYIVGKISNMSLENYMKKEIFEPLDMKDTTFFLNEEQKKRLARVYKRKEGKLIDVTGTKEDMYGILHQGETHFEAGCAGLFSTVTDYEHFVQMLCNEGNYNGKQLLKPETVQLMHTEAQEQHLEPDPGCTWGLSVKIRQDPKRGGSFASKGTYGWSGAFGTHFFVSPEEKLEAVFVTNRSDIGGSGSYVSTKVEELVFGIFGDY